MGSGRRSERRGGVHRSDRSDLAAVGLAIHAVIAAAVVWDFWIYEDAMLRQVEMTVFTRNRSMAGGSLALLAVNGTLGEEAGRSVTGRLVELSLQRPRSASGRAGSVPTMSTAFTNATIWPAVGPVIEHGSLLVGDGKILAIGSDVDPGDAEIVECSGKIITPGFIDCHSHVGIFGEGSNNDWDGNETSEAITPHVRVLDSIHPEDLSFADARRGGVTTMGITHGSANPIGGQVAVTKSAGITADAMVIKEPAGVKMALGENPKRVGDANKRAPNTRMGSAYLARKAFVEAIEYRKDWEHHAALVAVEEAKPESERKPLRAPKRDLGKEILVRVLEGEIPVRNHCHRMDDIRTAIRLSEEFGYRLVIDHATESYRIPDEILSRNLPMAIGPVMVARSKREVINRTPATPGIMVKAGGTVAIMTDAPVNPIDSLRDLVVFAIREGLPQDRALETITINPATILGVEDRVGSLEPGKDADFLIFDGDPWDARNRIRATYIDGEQVYEDTGPYVP